jgi:hypothetical protein
VACATRQDQPVDLVAPLARPDDPETDKAAFALDLATQTATCPQGQTVTGQAGAPKLGRPTLRFTFPRATCEACPLFKRCVKSKTAGRSVQTHPYEAYLQAARQRQQTAEFQDTYRLRPPVERKQAELVQHGLRHTRYLGHPKRQLQRLWQAATVNLKRLFRLCESRKADLNALLAHLEPPPLRGRTA